MTWSNVLPSLLPVLAAIAITIGRRKKYRHHERQFQRDMDTIMIQHDHYKYIGK